MTLLHDHAVCDGPHRGDPATTPITSEWFEQWERIPMENGGEAHLCPPCIVRRDKGWLAEPFVLECARCGRNTVDNPELQDWRTGRDPSTGAAVHICIECFDPGDDVRRA
jgi:sulfur relay (sulfurtransferase) complex TusBCD TusD component (DsrE family)